MLSFFSIPSYEKNDSVRTRFNQEKRMLFEYEYKMCELASLDPSALFLCNIDFLVNKQEKMNIF